MSSQRSAGGTLTVDVRGRARRLVTGRTLRELGRQVRRAQVAAGADGALALSLTDDAELRGLNRQFAGEDHATDVLSFSQREGRGMTGGLLGDVVISVEQAQRQAAVAGQSMLSELVHLAVHGLAHLLGCDHRTKKEEAIMFGYEARLRAQARVRARVRRVRRPSRSQTRSPR